MLRFCDACVRAAVRVWLLLLDPPMRGGSTPLSLLLLPRHARATPQPDLDNVKRPIEAPPAALAPSCWPKKAQRWTARFKLRRLAQSSSYKAPPRPLTRRTNPLAATRQKAKGRALPSARSRVRPSTALLRAY